MSTAGFYDRYWALRVQRGDPWATGRVKLRHEQTADLVGRRFPRPKGVRIADLGCGDGVLGQVLSPCGYTVAGVDVSKSALELSAAHYASVCALDLDVDPTPPEMVEAFEAVVCLEVLEHLEKPRQAIRWAFDCCRPGGLAVFSFPNLFSWKNRLCFLRGRWPNGYTTYDPREHLQVIELPQIRHWIESAGFDLRETAITPDLPVQPLLRALMFRLRDVLARLGPSLWAMQIVVSAEKPRDTET